MNIFNILIADADRELGQVLRTILREMGFENVEVTRSGEDAYRIFQETPIDFLITEWNTLHMDGLDLISKIRRDPFSPNPVLPIIMLTGRAERSDVEAARDHGINEYVVKPFSAKTIYTRLERIVEQPRDFVISEHFVGPNRRTRGTPPNGTDDRRGPAVAAQPAPVIRSGQNEARGSAKIWTPDFTLKKKLGRGKSLPNYITPQHLAHAQDAINAITNESLLWIKENLAELSQKSTLMAAGKQHATIASDLSDLALTVNSRAGTFGYTRASEVAYMLYLFCRTQLNPNNTIHHLIVQKHIDILRVIFAQNLNGKGGESGEEIVAELAKLVEKYSS